MYNIVYRPEAEQDYYDTLMYLYTKLHSKQAAENFANAYEKAMEQIARFPMASTRHEEDRPLRHKYRKILVKHYWVYFAVDDKALKITVYRIAHARMDTENVID